LLFEATKKEKPQAAARYEAALAAERDALAAAGVDSYAGFLMAIAAGGATTPAAPSGPNTGDDAERADAEAELAAATAEVDRLRSLPPPVPVARREDFAERDLELRARAAQLLG